MPNICKNELTVWSRDEDQVRSFIKFVESDDSIFDFNKIIPSPDWDNTPDENDELPTDVEEIRNKSGKLVMSFNRFPTSGKTDDRWYKWNCDNWGTKWNAMNEDMQFDEKYGDEVSYKFDTAWSPPAPILKKLKFKFPELNILWFYRIEEWEACGFLHKEIEDL